MVYKARVFSLWQCDSFNSQSLWNIQMSKFKACFIVDLSGFDLCICLSRLILDKTKVSIKSFVQQFKVEHVVYLKKGIVICIQSNRFHFALYMYLFGRKYPYVVIDKSNWIFGRSVYIICLLVVSFINLNYLFMPHCCWLIPCTVLLVESCYLSKCVLD